jgi:hypothetical protein
MKAVATKSVVLSAMLLLVALSAGATQPLGVRLMDINDSSELKAIFSSEAGKVRAVVILSPT